MAKSLRVICRISPNGDNTIPVTSSNTSVSLNAQTFNFDHVYSENTKQSEIFHKEIDILLKEALLGTSGCFFAFGTTQYHIFRSGKSYTIRGGEEGKHRGILTRSAEKLINLIEKETQRHLELKLSVVQIYQDIISDLMVCGSRGMPMTNEENPKIENLTEVSLEKTADLYGNLRYALQMRNSLLKADAKLKTRSHFIVFLKIFENGSEIATISFVDLAGSENASSDKSVYSMNFVSQEEKKSIARTFNIISKVLTYHEGIWKESKLTNCLKNNIENNVIFCCNISINESIIKHTLAALKYSNRIKSEAENRENPLVLEIQKIRKEIKDYEIENSTIKLDWIIEKERIIQEIHAELTQNPNLIHSRYVHECQLLKSDLEQIKNHLLENYKKSDLASSPIPKRERSRSPGLKYRSPSPIIKDTEPSHQNHSTEKSSERDEKAILTAKLHNTQSLISLHLRKIEDMNIQLKERESLIGEYHLEIDNLREINKNQENIINDQSQRLIEGYSKIADMSAKLQEYAVRLQQLKGQNPYPNFESQIKTAREELLEAQVTELQKQLNQDREGHRIQITHLNNAIDRKEKQFIELLNSPKHYASQDFSHNFSPERQNYDNIQLREAQDKLNGNQKIIDDFERQIHLLQKEITLNKDNIKDRQNFEENKVRNENYELVRINAELDQKLFEISKRNELLDFKVKESIRSNHDIEIKLNEITNKNIEIQQKITSLIDEKGLVENEKARVCEHNSKLMKEISNLQETNENQEIKIQNFLRNTEILQSEIDALRFKTEKQEEEFHNYKYEIEGKNYEMCVKDKQIEEIQRSSKFDHNENLKLKLENGNLKSQIQDLMSQNHKLDEEMQTIIEDKENIENELNKLVNELDKTSQKLTKQERLLEDLPNRSPSIYETKKLHKKIKKLKKERQENLDKNQKTIRNYEEQIANIIRERDLAMNELNNCREEQVTELSFVENQVNVIEQELVKLKELNSALQNREHEILKEFRKSEDLKIKYRDKCKELKVQIEKFKNYTIEAENYIKELIEKSQKVGKSPRFNEDRSQSLNSRLRALEDIKNLIKAHKHK